MICSENHARKGVKRGRDRSTQQLHFTRVETLKEVCFWRGKKYGKGAKGFQFDSLLGAYKLDKKAIRENSRTLNLKSRSLRGALRFSGRWVDLFLLDHLTMKKRDGHVKGIPARDRGGYLNLLGTLCAAMMSLAAVLPRGILKKGGKRKRAKNARRSNISM